MPLLQAALARRGLESTVVAWDDRRASFASFTLAIVRSTWDYVTQRDAFIAWARALPCPLANAPELLAWNTDKRYLRDLAAHGIEIVPTTWVEPGERFGDEDAARIVDAASESGDVVVKPSISAGARDTERHRTTTREGREAMLAHVARITASGRAAMVQPYVASVDARGETGLLFFAGEFSHAIEKSALLSRGAPGEVNALFAIERIVARAPSDRELAFARRVLSHVPPSSSTSTPLYARVDVVEDGGGAPRLLELELTEPSCFLDTNPGAADRFAQAIADRARAVTASRG